MVETFLTDFSRLNSVPTETASFEELCESGALFRYSGDPQKSRVTRLEQEFARYVGMKYALGVNSCSSAILLALKLCGVKTGTRVLVPAFTFTAVPSAIVHAGAEPILVETEEDFCMDVDDFRRKASQAKVLLLSHMRGYVSDLDDITKICDEHSIVMIEDAAHALGCTWQGKPVGSFGKIGCYSFQSNKIINTGEGGMLTTDDEELFAKAVILSGAYENLYRFHGIDSKLFDKNKKLLPLFNMRYTEIQAAMALPQLKSLDERAAAYRDLHGRLLQKIRKASNLVVFPDEDGREVRVPDSLQFRIPSFSAQQMKRFVTEVQAKGLPLFGLGIDKDNARAFWNWEYLGKTSNLEATRYILATTCDMRLPISLTDEHLDYAANAIGAAARTAETA